MKHFNFLPDAAFNFFSFIGVFICAGVEYEFYRRIKRHPIVDKQFILFVSACNFDDFFSYYDGEIRDMVEVE